MTSNIINTIKNSPIFSDFKPFQIEKFAEICSIIQFAKGEKFIQEGEFENSFYIIVKGEVEIVKTKDQSNYKLTVLKENEPVGEMILLKKESRSASAYALTQIEVLCVDLNKIENNPEYADLYQILSTKMGKIIVDRLRFINEVTIENFREKLSLGSFVINIIMMLSLYAIFLNFIQAHQNAFISTGTIAVLTCVFLFTMVSSGYPLKNFGLTFNNWRKVTIEAIIYTAPILVLLTLVKFILISFVPNFIGVKLFDPMSFLRITSPDNITLQRYFLELILYVASCPLQEICMRAATQSTLSRFLEGSKSKHPILLSIIFSNIFFAGSHSHIGATYPLLAPFLVFIPGLYWGWMFARQKSVIGVSVSHILLGCYLILVLGVPIH